jgi:hypothetical protein
MIFLLVYVPLTSVISFVDNEEHQWASDLVDALWGELMKPYKATGWYWLMEPVSMIVRASLSGFLLTDICLPGAQRMRLVLSFGIALIYAWGGAGINGCRRRPPARLQILFSRRLW